MRITFIIPFPDLAGGIRIIASFADRLQRRGHEVSVIAQPAEPIPLLRRLRSKIDVRRKICPRPMGPYFNGLQVQPRFIDRHRPIIDTDIPDGDVVIATWWETAEWMAKLSPTKGVKCHFIQQYEANFGSPEDRVADVWRLPTHKIVCSQWLADLARDRFGDNSAAVVPNGVDLDLFNAPPRKRQDKPTVGFMYSADPVKGCEVTLKAIRLAEQAVNGLRVIAFGSRPPSEALPLPAGARFNLQPPQNILSEIYASCDAWICGSQSEGFHLPPHEAMACRCPVISTRVGGPMDMITDGENGFLVNIGDADALAARLIQVLKMTEPQWQAMSKAAYATARSFTWEAATMRFEAALEVAVASGSTRFDSQMLSFTP